MKKRWTRHRPLFATPIPKHVRKPKIKWRILPIFWAGFKRMCFLLGFMLFMSALIGVYSASFITKQTAPSLPKEMVLYLKLQGDIRELPAPPSFADPFAQTEPTLRQLVDAIDHAAEDDRVKGIYARMYDGSFSLTHIQELRAAIQRFKDSGKFTYFYSSSLGEGGSGIARYYLASVFDEIWMQPLGIVSIAGMRAEVPFLRGVLDKLGVLPQFYQRKEFKTAYESITSREMSPENKRMLSEIVAGMKAAIMSEVPYERGMSETEFQLLVDRGLFPAEQAIDARLITHRNYVDVLIRRIKSNLTGNPEYDDRLFVSIPNYLSLAGRSSLMDAGLMAQKPRIALIYAVGAIIDSRTAVSAPSGLVDDGFAAADEIALALFAAADDPAIEAVVLRVDSPGGSPLASETILRAVQRVKDAGKPVIVSMGETAASGGYWISAYADHIFASPTTLTGSIGVVGGKFSIGELTQNIGVNWNRDIQWGENAGLWSLTTPFDSSEAARINLMLDEVYEAFLERVSKGRNMSLAEVDNIAKGRVWTGAKAQEIGLVDDLGGLHEALNYTAQTLGVESHKNTEIVLLPKPKSRLEQILQMLNNQGAVYGAIHAQAMLFSALAPSLREAAIIGSGDPVLAYEPLKLR